MNDQLLALKRELDKSEMQRTCDLSFVAELCREAKDAPQGCRNAATVDALYTWATTQLSGTAPRKYLLPENGA